MELIKYPDINQFRNVVKTVRTHHNYRGKDDEGEPIYQHYTPYPILEFQGTVKLHGSNGAIGFDEGCNMWVQSRNRVLTPEDDNAGFAKFVYDLPANIIGDFLRFTNLVLYGEWCGGSIQKGVAINKLGKMFVVFSAKYKDRWDENSLLNYLPSEWEELNNNNIYSIDQFQTYKIKIDFNTPELVQNKLAELTKSVGDECPVAKHFSVTGIGEGIVWKCTTEGFESSDYWFKVKDERHSISKVKTLAPVDIEKANNVIEFVNNVVTENRLNQGISYLEEMNIDVDIKNTGDYLRWIFNDILKEESDTMEASGLNKKDIGSPVSRKAKEFWLKKVNTL